MRNPNASNAFLRNSKVLDSLNQPAVQSKLFVDSKKKKIPGLDAQEELSEDANDPDAITVDDHHEEALVTDDRAHHVPTPLNGQYQDHQMQSIETMLTSDSFGYGALEVVSPISMTTIGGGILGAGALASGGGSGGGGTGGGTVNVAPTISDAALYLPKLSPGAALPVGQVGALLSTLTGGINDENTSDPKGVAIIQVDSSVGSLYYSIDDGATWILASSVSESNALLLADNPSTRLYFLPVNGALGIVPNAVFFRAWDQSKGAAGARADATANGGDEAFSSDVESIALNIDVPILGDYTENGSPILANPNLILPAPVSGTFTGATVQIGGGFVTGDVLFVAGNAAITSSYDTSSGVLTLTGNASRAQYESMLRNVTFHSTSENPTFFGAVRPLIWQVTDAGGAPYVNTVNQVSIIEVNDAPTMFPETTGLTAAGYGYGAPGANSGDLVSRFTGSIVDPDTTFPNAGMAIIQIAPNTVLHFSTDGGRTWSTASDLTSTNALHLMADADNKFYMQTLPGFSGDASSAFAFRAWDQTSGVDGLRGSTLPAGGTSAYSLATGGGLPPEFVGPTAVSVAENTQPSTVIYDASANGDFNVVYSISGTDAALFAIESATGKLRFIQAPNFESPLDSGANNQYNLTIVAMTPFGRSATLDFTVNVTNVNETVVQAAGLDKNYSATNDTPGVWVTYSDGATFGRNIYASANGPDAIAAMQMRKAGGTWSNMTMSNGYAVHHSHDQMLPGTYTYEFRSLGADGTFSAISTQDVQVSAWSAAPGFTSITTANHSVIPTATISQYGSFNASADFPTAKGQVFTLSSAAISGFLNNGQSTFLYGGSTVDVSSVGGGLMTRQTDYLELIDSGTVLDLTNLRGQNFGVDKLNGFEFIEMTNSSSQAVIADGISLGAISSSGWLSNPWLLPSNYNIVIRGGANDALVLRKGGVFDFSNFQLVGASTGSQSAGNFYPGVGNFDIYRNSSTQQYVLLEQGVQISNWATGVNAAPVVIATNSMAVNSLVEAATATLSPINGVSSGVLVNSLVAGVYDADGVAVAQGIAITSVNPAGTLFYSTNGGSTWLAAASNISSTNALLLAADTDNRVYFKFNGATASNLSDAVVLKAWDRTTGADGAYASTAVSGGVSAFSVATENVRFIITTDTVNPQLVSSNPSDNGFLMAVGNNITLTFSEAVKPGTGTISLHRSSDNAIVESFNVATGVGSLMGSLTFSGSTITLNPFFNLVSGTDYYVRVAATAVTDLAGNAFAGINDSTTLNFSTAASDGSVSANPLYGAYAEDYLGSSISKAGDVNGDGYDDFIVSASGTNSAYVIYGNASGLGTYVDGRSIAASQGFKMTGGLSAGYTVSGAGDINADGFADLIVGVFGGGAYVVYGGSAMGNNVALTGIAANNGGFAIAYANNRALNAAGDINGDGLADFILSGSVNSYVVYGRIGRSNLDLSSGITPNDGFAVNFGKTASSAGDVNGDGFSDLIVGDGDIRSAFVVYGNSTGTSVNLNTNAIASSSGFKIFSTQVTNFGSTVSSAGDVNGDGLADVMVFNGTSTYVVYGKTTSAQVTIDGAGDISATDGFRISNAAGQMGASLAAAGDINGDGFADLLIGAPVSDLGAAYVVYGGSSIPNRVNVDSTSFTATTGFKITGAASFRKFAASVSSAGDINGDGLGDLIFGASSSHIGYQGGYSILLGGTQWLTNAISLTGTTAAEAVLGSRGDDTLTGGGGVDRFFAGLGNDTIVLSGSDVTNLSATTGVARGTIHGGGGFDTLRASAAGVNLNLTTISNAGAMGLEEKSRIESIERIDLGSDSAINTLTLNATDIKDMAGFNLIRTGSVSADGKTWTGSALAGTTRFHQLVVDGGSTDRLMLNTHAGVWSNVGTVNNGTNNYTVHQNTTTNTQVLVQEGVAVSTPPLLMFSSPGDNGYMLGLSNPITLTFDQPIEKGTGTISLHRTSDNSLVEAAYDVGSSRLIWGTNTLTIDPSINLTADTGYYVKVAPTAVKNAAGLNFLGINDTTTLNFSTAAADGTLTSGPDNTGGTFLGKSVSGAGDVNGDGFDDYIVSEHSTNSAFVVYGNASGSGVSLPDGTIEPSKGFKISGGNSLGFEVSGVGDFNGDGLSDVVVGAPTTAGGAAYVVYGNSTGASVAIDGSLNIAANQGLKITGGAGNWLGYVVSGAGDVNGDGFADLMVHGPGTGNNAVNYVVYGRVSSAGLSLVGGTIAATDGFKIDNVDLIYPPLSSAGDMNGDGLADVIVGANNSANVSVIYGKPSGTFSTVVPVVAGSSGFNITSAQGMFGNEAVSGVGDVNGDGLGDVIVGAAGTNSAYVVFGNTTGATVNINSTGGMAAGTGFRITGPWGSIGMAVSAAGDVNGDGLADVVVGSTNGAYVVYGKANGSTVNVDAGSLIAATDGFKISNSSSVITSIGDINGDGLGDLVIGSTGGSYSLFLGGTQWVTSAVKGAGTVTGTTAAEAIIGSTAADTLTGGGGVDRFFAGQGNDTIVLATTSDVTNLSVTTGATRGTIHGGGGFDTLRVSAAGVNLNLTTISNAGGMGIKENSRIESIERIDLGSDSFINTLTLNAIDIKDMAGFNLIRTGSTSADGKTWFNLNGGTALGATTAFHQLVVDGTSTDTLNLQAGNGGWFNAGEVSNGSANYVVYQNTGTRSQVIVNKTLAVNNNDPMAAGDALIDLGANGRLIAPVRVEGKWYYVWDRNGDGLHNSSTVNGRTDTVSMDDLETLFFGSSLGTPMTDASRTTVINGVTVMLPTRGDGLITTGNKAGTAVNSPLSNNAAYDDLMAIWDAFNGATTGTVLTGTPSLWASGAYLSSTVSAANSHFSFALNGGSVNSLLDTDATRYVALQVL